MLLEFRDIFSPCTSLTVKYSLVFHVITLQSKDAAINNSICTYPITLGYEDKDNMLVENAFIEEISNLQNPQTLVKLYSKKYKGCTQAVLSYAF